ncbi:MAG: hypothetical protein L7W39_04005 [Alphaproteobacteria bacterium]|nr:hypothetical protein [Alphaproteobacteria bacterium]
MWYLKGHSICVHDLDIAVDFFGHLIGLGKAEPSGENSLIFSSKRSYFQLVEPTLALRLDGPDILAPTAHRHVAIEIASLEQLKQGLENIAAPYVVQADIASAEAAICTMMPCRNMVIFSERNAEAIMPDAAEWEIHHVNLQAADVRRSTDFLKSCAGLQEGHWRAPEGKGDFSIDPADLSIFPIGDFNGGLHIIKPDPSFAKRNNFAHNPSIGGHPAIEVSDLMGVKSRLENAGVEVSDAGTYAMAGMHQIYCLDPTGNMIEVNQRVR